MFRSTSHLFCLLLVGCSSINLATGRSMIINLEDPESVLRAPDMPDNMKTFLLNMMMQAQQDTPASTPLPILPAAKQPAASLPLFPSPPASSFAGQRKTTPVRRSVKEEERRDLKEVATKVRRFARSEAARQQLFNRFTQMVNREVPIKPVVRRRVVLPASIVLAGAAEARREQQLAAAVSGQSQLLSSLIAQSGGPAVPANQDSSIDDRLTSAVHQATSTNQLLAQHQYNNQLAPLTANQRTPDRSLDSQLSADWFSQLASPEQSSTNQRSVRRSSTNQLARTGLAANYEVPESLI